MLGTSSKRISSCLPFHLLKQVVQIKILNYFIMLIIKTYSSACALFFDFFVVVVCFGFFPA